MWSARTPFIMCYERVDIIIIIIVIIFNCIIIIIIIVVTILITTPKFAESRAHVSFRLLLCLNDFLSCNYVDM